MRLHVAHGVSRAVNMQQEGRGALSARMHVAWRLGTRANEHRGARGLRLTYAGFMSGVACQVLAATGFRRHSATATAHASSLGGLV